jgi:hypothetical protein
MILAAEGFQRDRQVFSKVVAPHQFEAENRFRINIGAMTFRQFAIMSSAVSSTHYGNE